MFDYEIIRNCCWEDIMFDINVSHRGKGQLLNHILILVKHNIFIFRERKTPPTCMEIKTKIVDDKLKEKRLASTRIRYHYI